MISIPFETGGRDKSFEQIVDLPHSYILADGKLLLSAKSFQAFNGQ